MELTAGVQLSQVWDRLKLTDKLEIVTQLSRFQKQWLSARFANIGSLYYTKDVEESSATGHLYTDINGQEVKDERFVIGPATGRDWNDEGRSSLNCDRGPCKLPILAWDTLNSSFDRDFALGLLPHCAPAGDQCHEEGAAPTETNRHALRP